MLVYIEGLIRESLARCRALKNKFPGGQDNSIYFEQLVTKATSEIDHMISELEELLVDPTYFIIGNTRAKFFEVKLIIGDLQILENVIVAAIDRKNKHDDEMNEFVRLICKEINYPIQCPTVSCLSQRYYSIYPHYNLLCIPLLEGEFLLHLPDLYHELGHPLMSLDNPRLNKIQYELGMFNRTVKKSFDDEIYRLDLNQPNSINQDLLYVWRDCWIKKWSEEFFCDMFATYTLGPAYVWSNLHMCAKMDWEVHKIPIAKTSSHPPSASRTKAMFYALDKIGFEKERQDIEKRWEEFVGVIDNKAIPEYDLAIQDSLLSELSDRALEGVTNIGCNLASNNSDAHVIKSLNECWKKFWLDPTSFADIQENLSINLLSEIR